MPIRQKSGDLSYAPRNFNFKNSKILIDINNEQHRKTFESSIIFNYNTITQKSVFFNLSPYLV